MDNELRQLKAHIIDKHSYGGYTCMVQTVAQGVIDTISAFDLWDIMIWLEENHPDSMELHIQE